MSSADRDAEALARVHRGWDHLKLQRPLAAWASWQRALRIKPGDPAATEALEILASADDLPADARATYRFRAPRGDDRRARWDAHLREHDLAELESAADAFASLADADPEDAAAHYNRGLALAWLGRNAEAIAALDRFVTREAATDFDAAVQAWALAEILRQGAGAEEQSDDLSHSLTIPWPAEAGDPIDWLSGFASLRPVPSPIDPGPCRPVATAFRAFEWIDRPMPEPSSTLVAEDLPRVRASVVAIGGSLRFSSPDRMSLAMVEHDLRSVLGDWDETPDGDFDRRSTPLPIALMDAAVWRFALPDGPDPGARDRLGREAVERYYETSWILGPRRGLGGLEGAEAVSPVLAAFAIGRADPTPGLGVPAVLRAKLAAVVRVREQLAARPRVAALSVGYPFDRLRRRLGLEPIDPATVDPADPSCMSPDELGRLDPASLGDAPLLEAYLSSRGVCPGEVVDRLAVAVAERDPSALIRPGLPDLAASVVLSAGREHGLEGGRSWLDRAVALDEEAGGRGRARLQMLRARLLGDFGPPGSALDALRAVPEIPEADVSTLLTAAAQLVILGDPECGRRSCRRALELADRTGDRINAARARSILAAFPLEDPP